VEHTFQRKKINDTRVKRNYDRIPTALIENRRKEIFSADNFYKTEYFIIKWIKSVNKKINMRKEKL